MDKVLLLLLIAGLVAGVFLIGANLRGTRTAPPEDVEEQIADSVFSPD